MTVSADLKIVYRDKDEAVVKQSNFSNYTSTANLFYDYPFVIAASTSETLFSYISPSNNIFPVAADLLIVKNKGEASVGVIYTNAGSQTIEVEVKAGRLMVLPDVDITYEIVLTNTSAYSNEVEIFLAGH